MKKYLILILLVPLVLAFQGNSVTMRFESQISPFDTLSNKSSYALFTNKTAVTALIAANRPVYTKAVKNAQNLIEVRQGLDNNQFYLVFTSGNERTISKKIPSIKKNNYISKHFTSQNEHLPPEIKHYIRLEYQNINLTNKERWTKGSHTLLIKNKGTAVNPQIYMEVVR